MPSNKAAQDKHPRITNPGEENANPDDGTVTPEELAKDPNAADYLQDQDKTTSPDGGAEQTPSSEPSPATQEPAPENQNGEPGTDKENKPEEPQAPQLPALDMKALTKNGGEGLVAIIGLISQMQQQMMEMQKQIAAKVDTEKVDPKVFLTSGATKVDAQRHADKARRTAEFVNAQPKVSIFIPLEGKEKVGQAILPVTINGHRWNVPKGVYVDVPKPVGDIVKDSLNQTEAAYVNAFRLDNAPEEKRQALEG